MTNIAYKGFNGDLACRDFQFEVGETYVHEGDVAACASGFHVCTDPFDVWGFYPPAGSRFALVEYDGKTDGHDTDSKLAVEKLTVKAELSLAAFIKVGVEAILKRAKETKAETGGRSAATNTGDRSAATNTGHQSAATNTGDRSAATNTGDWSAATNTGSRSAATNTGYRSAATNTGNQSAATNTGHQSAATNTGHQSAATNTGSRSAATNTGDRSAATVGGKNSVAVASGYGGKAKASKGSGFVVAEHDRDGNLIRLHAAMAGQDGIMPDTFYRAKNGKLVEAA